MGTVILSGARTPIGKLSGAFASLTGSDLGGIAIRAALERAGVSPDQVDYVVMGQVLQAGTGQLTARQAARRADIPMSVPATTINKVCLSGLNAIHLADQMIQAGEAEIVVAGGMESMTNAPFLLPGARGGYRYGNNEILDAIQHERAVLCARVRTDGREHRALRGFGVDRPRGAGHGCRSEPRPRRPRHQGRPARRRDRAGRDPPAPGRPRSWSTRTRASGRRPTWTRSALCARRSPSRATSPPATRRRSPTGRRPRSSRRTRWPSGSASLPSPS